MRRRKDDWLHDSRGQTNEIVAVACSNASQPRQYASRYQGYHNPAIKLSRTRSRPTVEGYQTKRLFPATITAV